MIENIIAWLTTLAALATCGCFYYAWKGDRFSCKENIPRVIERISKSDASGEEEEREIVEYIEENITDLEHLKLAYRSAQKMCYAERMDDALIEITKKAIDIKALDFAYEVARSAHYAATKDRMLSMIVDAGIKVRNLRVAEIASDAMHYSSNKDAAKRKIVDGIKVG